MDNLGHPKQLNKQVVLGSPKEFRLRNGHHILAISHARKDGVGMLTAAMTYCAELPSSNVCGRCKFGRDIAMCKFSLAKER